MAAIDKIYLNLYDEYLQFKNWCSEQPPFVDKYGVTCRLINYVHHWNKEDWTDNRDHPVMNAPCYVDAQIIRNCPLDFVQKAIMINYGHRSQSEIDEMYKTIMARGGREGKQGTDYWYWLTKDDFKVVDGVVTFPENENSSYMKIKRGELYAKPIADINYEIGRHVKCTRHPYMKYNRPLKGKWTVSIHMPNGEYMWYHDNHNSWDNINDFVECDWSSSCAHVKTIKALKRLMVTKWKFPVGTIVNAVGQYVGEEYLFVITK